MCLCERDRDRERATIGFRVWRVKRGHLHSALVAGGFLVAQFVLMDLDPSHCPFMAAIAFSASWKRERDREGKEG